MIDNRKMLILSAIVDEYIKTGEPIGSNLVLRLLDINISSATVRNDMAFLEKAGLLEQTHTSSGRIPTYDGYRYYIDNIMRPKRLSQKEKIMIDDLLIKGDTADAIIENAVDVMSELTNLAVVSKSNVPVFSIISKVEVIPAGRRLYALLIITSSGTIKNKICRMEFDLTNEQLEFFKQFASENLTGLNVDMLTPAMLQNLAVALGTYMLTLSPLLHAVYQLSEEIMHCNVNLKGEQNLINTMDSNEVVALMSHKNQLEDLLTSAFDGISVIFGNENDNFVVTNSSLILSQYKIDGKSAGSFGAIGPIRVDYSKIIPHIEYITQSVTKLLEEHIKAKDK